MFDFISKSSAEILKEGYPFGYNFAFLKDFLNWKKLKKISEIYCHFGKGYWSITLGPL